MRNLKLKYVRITFIDGKSVEFNNELVDYIDVCADSDGFNVKLYYIILDNETTSHIERYIFDIDLIESIEQRWKKVEKDAN